MNLRVVSVGRRRWGGTGRGTSVAPCPLRSAERTCGHIHGTRPAEVVARAHAPSGTGFEGRSIGGHARCQSVCAPSFRFFEMARSFNARPLVGGANENRGQTSPRKLRNGPFPLPAKHTRSARGLDRARIFRSNGGTARSVSRASTFDQPLSALGPRVSSECFLLRPSTIRLATSFVGPQRPSLVP